MGVRGGNLGGADALTGCETGSPILHNPGGGNAHLSPVDGDVVAASTRADKIVGINTDGNLADGKVIYHKVVAEVAGCTEGDVPPGSGIMVERDDEMFPVVGAVEDNGVQDDKGAVVKDIGDDAHLKGAIGTGVLGLKFHHHGIHWITVVNGRHDSHRVIVARVVEVKGAAACWGVVVLSAPIDLTGWAGGEAVPAEDETELAASDDTAFKILAKGEGNLPTGRASSQSSPITATIGLQPDNVFRVGVQTSDGMVATGQTIGVVPDGVVDGLVF